MPAVALATDPLVTPSAIGGGEKVLSVVHRHLFPAAPVFTPLVAEHAIPPALAAATIHTSFLQHWPGAARHLEAYIPVLPWAVESMNLQAYDGVISFHHTAAKAVLTRPDAVHVCYCHSPARYFWDQTWVYQHYVPRWQRWGLQTLGPLFRTWDTATAGRVTTFVANSRWTARRIERYYGKPARVVHPPVETIRFYHRPAEDFFLIVGRLVEYKGIALAIQAFNTLGWPLVIIGQGPQAQVLKQQAASNIRFLGALPDAELVDWMSRCQGLIHPGVEDFGIVMAEAQAAGKPVIGLSRGGAPDIVRHGDTGWLLSQASADELVQAVRVLAKREWDARAIQAHARQFSTEAFLERFSQVLAEAGLWPTQAQPEAKPVAAYVR